MATTGVQSIYLETHSWHDTSAFLLALGFTIDFAQENSGLLRNEDGPQVFVQEVPAGRELENVFVLAGAGQEGWEPSPAVEVIHPFKETHWGAQEMKVRDPDGRTWSIQVP